MIIIHEAKKNPVANLCPEPSSPKANVLKLQRVSCGPRNAVKNGLGASDAWEPWVTSGSSIFFRSRDFFEIAKAKHEPRPKKSPGSLTFLLESWLVNKDPYFMVHYNPYITG